MERFNETYIKKTKYKYKYYKTITRDIYNMENIQNNIFITNSYSINIEKININEKTFYHKECVKQLSSDCHNINIEIDILQTT